MEKSDFINHEYNRFAIQGLNPDVHAETNQYGSISMRLDIFTADAGETEEDVFNYLGQENDLDLFSLLLVDFENHLVMSLYRWLEYKYEHGELAFLKQHMLETAYEDGDLRDIHYALKVWNKTKK